MDVLKGKLNKIAWMVLVVVFFAGCDFVGQDVQPTILKKKIDVLKLKNSDFAIDLSSAYPGYNFAGVSPNAGKYVTYDSEENILVYKPGEDEEEFQIEFSSKDNEFLLGDVRFKELAAADCGAQNFTSATVSNDSKLTVDLLLNEDMCGTKEIDINSLALSEKFIGNTTGDEYETFELRGYTGGTPGKGYIILTFDPKDDFVGTVEIEYIATVEIDRSNDPTLEEILENPELSEFYTRHTAVITVTD